MTRANNYWMTNNSAGNSDWDEGAYYTGNQRAARVLTDRAYVNWALAWGATNQWLIGPGGSNDADSYCCGQTYIDLYRLTSQLTYITSITNNVNTWVASPATNQLYWIDAFYMAGPTFASVGNLTDAQKAAACGCIEPSSNRYWCYIPMPDGSAGLIFVFSYFPSSQVSAWGAYLPTYQVALLPPAANYTASTITYAGLTVGARYAWLPGAHEVSIVNGTTTLKSEGAFTAPVTYTGALSQTETFVPTRMRVYNGQIWGIIYLTHQAGAGYDSSRCRTAWRNLV